MIEGHVGHRFCKQTIGLVLLAIFHYTIHCFASVGARIALSLDSGQKWNTRLFWDETKLTKPLLPSGQTRRTS